MSVELVLSQDVLPYFKYISNSIRPWAIISFKPRTVDIKAIDPTTIVGVKYTIQGENLIKYENSGVPKNTNGKELDLFPIGVLTKAINKLLKSKENKGKPIHFRFTEKHIEWGLGGYISQADYDTYENDVRAGWDIPSARTLFDNIDKDLENTLNPTQITLSYDEWYTLKKYIKILTKEEPDARIAKIIFSIDKETNTLNINTDWQGLKVKPSFVIDKIKINSINEEYLSFIVNPLYLANVFSNINDAFNWVSIDIHERLVRLTFWDRKSTPPQLRNYLATIYRERELK